MKKKILPVISVLAFVLILCLVLHGVYNSLRWKDTTGDYLSSFDQLYATDQNLVDVVFLGPSHCYDNCYPAFLWENAGIASFDMAVSGQDRDSSYHHLKELLKTQKPKVVFLELAALTFDENDQEGNAYRNLLSMKPSLNSVQLIREYLTRYGKKDSIYDYLALFPIIHSRYKELQRRDIVTYSPNTYMRGEHVCWDVNEIDYCGSEGIEPSNEALKPEHIEWLDNICALAEKEGFSLVFYVAPYQLSAYEQGLYLAAEKYGEERGIKTIDFNRMPELGFDPATDFFDTAHCNAYGAKKSMDYITDFLLENYDLADHRGDSRYSQWDKDLIHVYEQQMIRDLAEADSADSFLDIAGQMSDVTVIVSLEGGYGKWYDDSYRPALSALGISADDYEKGGKWIYADGQCIKGHENDDSAPFYYELGKYDTLRLCFEGDLLHSENIMIGHEGYSHTGFCLQLIVYDNSLEEVVGVGLF